MCFARDFRSIEKRHPKSQEQKDGLMKLKWLLKATQFIEKVLGL